MGGTSMPTSANGPLDAFDRPCRLLLVSGLLVCAVGIRSGDPCPGLFAWGQRPCCLLFARGKEVSQFNTLHH